MGHVVGNNIETVTLPYGYKKYTTNGVATAVTDLHTTITSAEDGADTDAVATVETTSSTADNTQDTLAVDTHNKWIQTKLENDKLTIAHEIHAIPTDSNGTTNANSEKGASDENNINIPDWAYDEAGHITEKHDHFYTLPFGYKEITSGSASAAVTDLTSNSNTIVADKTQDTLVVAAGNKWIKTAANADTDTLSIAHEVHDITTTDKDTTALDSGTGSFIVQDLLFDEAGHATANQPHTYTLPYTIRNITVAGSDAVTEGTTTGGTVSAKSYNDTVNLNAQNRWINVKVEGDTISIGHAAAGGTTIKTGGATDPTNSETKTLKFGEKFTTPYVKYDEMGHITETGAREVTVPIGSLTDTNSTNAANVLTGISFTAKDGAITTTHQNVSTLLLTGHTDTTTGHVSATDSISGAFIKLDKRIDNLDVTDTTTGGDVVSTVQQTDGKITVAHTNVGALNLTGYTLPTVVSNLNLSPNESLNTALGKLEFRLNDLDYSDESTTQVISKITQTDGKIAVTRANAGDLLLTGYVKA
jgi:hypothetical protein